MNKKLFQTLIFSYCALVTVAQRPDNYCPTNSAVQFTQSTLTTVKINVDGKEIQRQNAIDAHLSIIDDGADAIFDGDATIKYVGWSTFTNSEKKSYLIKSGNRSWLLKGEGADRSMIRTLLSTELAAKFMSKVPTVQLCEVTIDGIYYGIYNLTEPNESLLNDGEKLVSVGRNDIDNSYISSYEPYTASGSTINYASTVYQYISPGDNDASAYIAAMEQALRVGDFNKINLTSFADYALNSEFAHNADSYRLHSDIYFSADGTASMLHGDATLGFGNYDAYEGFRSDTWVYGNNDMLSAQDEPQLVPFYWYTLTHNADFQSLLQSRWAEYRKDAFTTENIYKLIDEYADRLKTSGAIERNESAWSIWSRKLWANYYRSTSFDDEVLYLKNWIAERIDWIDNNIGKEDVIDPNSYTEVKPIAIASGFNEDCIAESFSDVPTSVSNHPALDGHGSVLVSADVLGVSNGIPANGYLVADSGNPYQLASYTANNCLYLKQTGSTGTLTFAEPVTAKSLCVLLVGTNRDMYELDYTPIVTFSDNTTEQIATQYVSDWCVEAYNDFVYKNLNRYRTDYNGGGIDGTLVNLSENKFEVSSDKPIKSITFTSQCRYDTYGYGMIGIFAVSAEQSVSSGVEQINTPSAVKTIKTISDLTGRLHTSLQKGLNIVVYTDGSTAKLILR